MEKRDIDAIATRAYEMDLGEGVKPEKVTREVYTWWVEHVLRAAGSVGFQVRKEVVS